jgi:hypothetical protein
VLAKIEPNTIKRFGLTFITEATIPHGKFDSHALQSKIVTHLKSGGIELVAC